jgi:hypothetical protein
MKNYSTFTTGNGIFDCIGTNDQLNYTTRSESITTIYGVLSNMITGSDFENPFFMLNSSSLNINFYPNLTNLPTNLINTEFNVIESGLSYQLINEANDSPTLVDVIPSINDGILLMLFMVTFDSFPIEGDSIMINVPIDTTLSVCGSNMDCELNSMTYQIQSRRLDREVLSSFKRLTCIVSVDWLTVSNVLTTLGVAFSLFSFSQRIASIVLRRLDLIYMNDLAGFVEINNV